MKVLNREVPTTDCSKKCPFTPPHGATGPHNMASIDQWFLRAPPLYKGYLLMMEHNIIRSILHVVFPFMLMMQVGFLSISRELKGLTRTATLTEPADMTGYNGSVAAHQDPRKATAFKMAQVCWSPARTADTCLQNDRWRPRSCLFLSLSQDSDQMASRMENKNYPTQTAPTKIIDLSNGKLFVLP